MKRLILGGVKSGKSRYAEACVKAWLDAGGMDQNVRYIATAQNWGDGFAERIERHRQQRPASWITVEEPIEIAEIIQAASGRQQYLLVECLTLWMSNLLADQPSDEQLTARIDPFCAAVATYQGELVLVSNEVGLGIMPMNALARRFADEVGVLHQRLAPICDEVVLTVAGIPQRIKAANQ